MGVGVRPPPLPLVYHTLLPARVLRIRNHKGHKGASNHRFAGAQREDGRPPPSHLPGARAHACHLCGRTRVSVKMWNVGAA
jgi:hypothetical protein